MTRLAIVYHRPFIQAPDGGLYEAEGAFSTYVESLAPHFAEIILVVPARQGEPRGYRLSADNVRLCPLPDYDGIAPFYRSLPRALLRTWRDSAGWDLVNLRVPTLFAPYAFAIARLRRIPVFLLVVGDLRAAAQAVPRRTWKRRLYRLYVELDERLLDAMAARSLTFCNGRALYAKYARPGRRVIETRTSTLSAEAFFHRDDTCQGQRIQLLCVSRVDPRKGLRFLPAALATLVARGHDVRLRIIGPIVGSPGAEERAETLRRAEALGVADRVQLTGPATIDQVFRAYRESDVFVLPSLPGEGVPRVLTEAMAASLPIVTTRVAGIPDAIQDGVTGLLVAPTSSEALAAALERIITDGALRRALIANGYREAQRHTAARQTELLVGALARAYPGLFPAQATPRRSLRVAIPLAGFNPSGGVQSLIHLANGLAARGHRVRFVVPDFAAQPPRPLAPGVSVRALHTGPLPRRLRQLLYYLRLLVESTQGADVCLANYWPTAYTALSAKLLRDRGTALAYNVRAYEPLTHGALAESSAVGRRLRSLLARWSYRLPLPKLVTSAYLKRLVGDPGAAVMGHGIEPQVFQPLGRAPAGDRVTVGVIGRRGPVKGYQDFLAAVALLPPDLPLRLLVAGEQDVPLPDRFPAQRCPSSSEAEMAAFYHACDIFIFPSRSEGFGLPALEALACGCALVTTDCGGVREFACPEENCLVVPPADPAALAAAIQRLAQDQSLRPRLAARGAPDAQRSSREAVTARFEQALLALAAGR